MRVDLRQLELLVGSGTTDVRCLVAGKVNALRILPDTADSASTASDERLASLARGLDHGVPLVDISVGLVAHLVRGRFAIDNTLGQVDLRGELSLELVEVFRIDLSVV